MTLLICYLYVENCIPTVWYPRVSETYYSQKVPATSSSNLSLLAGLGLRGREERSSLEVTTVTQVSWT